MSHVDPYWSSMANNLWLSRTSHDPMLKVARKCRHYKAKSGGSFRGEELGVLSFRGNGLVGDKGLIKASPHRIRPLCAASPAEDAPPQPSSSGPHWFFYGQRANVSCSA